ncbi:MAG: hypothetical protein ACXV39_12865 [Halobacteriota archaeon]
MSSTAGKVAKKLHTDLKPSEECKASLVEKLRQSEALKNTAFTGLEHEVELLQQKLANLETLLHTERGLTFELRHDRRHFRSSSNS